MLRTRSDLKLSAKELEVDQGDLGPGLIFDDGNDSVLRCKSVHHLLHEAALLTRETSQSAVS
jgi:hypothetical protein